MTFGQRIELGRIITNKGISEYERFRGVLRCLHKDWSIAQIVDSLDYYEQILEGVLYWVQREGRELHYEPTAEERLAGIEALSRNVGEMSTIMAIATDLKQDPDEVLRWKYGKVFNILYTNLQSHLYRERLEKIAMERARKR